MVQPSSEQRSAAQMLERWILLFAATGVLASAAPPPLKGCLWPHDTHTFCDTTKSAAQRAALLANMLTVPELISAMQGDTPAIKRLGIPAYHYGYEALHGMIQNCPFPDRCFTSFPCSSASAASFNRSLWHAIGSAQIDEVRGMYNSQTDGNQGVITGMHVRGPQLNPQVCRAADDAPPRPRGPP